MNRYRHRHILRITQSFRFYRPSITFIALVALCGCRPTKHYSADAHPLPLDYPAAHDQPTKIDEAQKAATSCPNADASLPETVDERPTRNAPDVEITPPKTVESLPPQLRIRDFSVSGCHVCAQDFEESVPTEPSWPTTTDGETLSYPLSNGRRILIENKQASILDKNDNLLAKNETIIRLQDEEPFTMSEGFLSASPVKGGFVIEQGNGGGWNIISEKIEFRFSKRDNAVYLKKFSLVYIDRRDPAEENDKSYVLTDKDFGQIRFEEVDLEKLYELAWKKGKDRP